METALSRSSATENSTIVGVLKDVGENKEQRTN